MEKIRTALGIEKWLVFGGSWGTTLALHYTIAHRERVVGLMLRGIFLGRQSDVDWLYQDGASHFYPENFEKFKAPIPVAEQGELVNAYYKRLTSEDESICLEAARAWAEWEHGLVKLIPYDPIVWDEAGIRGALTIARMECHFFYHHCFVEDDNYILNRAEAFKGIPMHIVHGRYDVDCLPRALTTYCSEIGCRVVRSFVLLGSLVGLVAGALCSEGAVSACAMDVAEV